MRPCLVAETAAFSASSPFSSMCNEIHFKLCCRAYFFREPTPAEDSGSLTETLRTRRMKSRYGQLVDTIPMIPQKLYLSFRSHPPSFVDEEKPRYSLSHSKGKLI